MGSWSAVALGLFCGWATVDGLVAAPGARASSRGSALYSSTFKNPARSGGRGRAAKYVASREAESLYAARLRGLLRSEREAEERAAKARLEEWSEARLLAQGVAVVGLGATRLPRGARLLGGLELGFEARHLRCCLRARRLGR